MKIEVEEYIDLGDCDLSVENLIARLSKYVGMEASVEIDYDGTSAINISYLREEAGPEQSERIRQYYDDQAAIIVNEQKRFLYRCLKCLTLVSESMEDHERDCYN